MINAPGKSGTRSQIADWLEIRALLNLDSSSSLINSVASVESADHGTDENDEDIEIEIAESEVENSLDMVAYELGFRHDALKGSYPFRFEALPSGHFSLELELDEDNQAHQMYIFMLLVSAARDKVISLPDNGLSEFMTHAGTLFHICASIGVAGLMHAGRTFWFGFPRPEGSNFLEALKDLASELKYPKPKPKIPAGMSAQAKDEEIDIVGWRPFADNRIGGLVILCQAASGKNWRSKSISGAVPSFSKTFFEQGPYAYGVSAMAIPFMAHHEVELRSEDIDEDFEDACYNLLWKIQSGFGIILDRTRIVQTTKDVFERDDLSDAVAGIDLYGDVQSWSATLRQNLAVIAA